MQCCERRGSFYDIYTVLTCHINSFCFTIQIDYCIHMLPSGHINPAYTLPKQQDLREIPVDMHAKLLTRLAEQIITLKFNKALRLKRAAF